MGHVLDLQGLAGADEAGGGPASVVSVAWPITTTTVSLMPDEPNSPAFD